MRRNIQGLRLPASGASALAPQNAEARAQPLRPSAETRSQPSFAPSTWAMTPRPSLARAGALGSGRVRSASPSSSTSAVSSPESLDLWVQHSSPSASRILRQWSLVSATINTGRPARMKVSRTGWEKVGPERQKVLLALRETSRGTGNPEGVSRRSFTGAGAFAAWASVTMFTACAGALLLAACAAGAAPVK